MAFNIYIGGQHYDVYYNPTIQNGKSTSNGGPFHLNYYSGGNVSLCGNGNGNVGIGMASPTQAKLVVDASSIAGIYLMGDYTTFNYILYAPPPGYTTGGAVHFINSTTRTDDGGETCYTIRNDSGPIRLGQVNQITTIEGSNIILDGNVGIGTTVLIKLDLKSTGLIKPMVFIFNDSSYPDTSWEYRWVS